MKQLTVGAFLCLLIIIKARSACVKYEHKPEVLCGNITPKTDVPYVADSIVCSISNLSDAGRNCSDFVIFTCDACGQLQPDVFKHMGDLEYLEITSQNISQLTRDYLKPLNMLKDFTLKDSSIYSIEEGAFCQSDYLEELSLLSNSIFSPITKSAFANCRNVRSLFLRGNENLVIEADAFSDFRNVNYVSLGRLKMSQLKKEVIGGLKNTEYLEIGDSDISKIDADCFSDFNNLKKLNLFGNKLVVVDSEIIAPISKLVLLVLANNSITNIDNITHPTLEYLFVYDNQITDVNPEAIKENLPKLQRLFIYRNPITPEKKEALQKDLAPVTVDV